MVTSVSVDELANEDLAMAASVDLREIMALTFSLCRCLSCLSRSLSSMCSTSCCCRALMIASLSVESAMCWVICRYSSVVWAYKRSLQATSSSTVCFRLEMTRSLSAKQRAAPSETVTGFIDVLSLTVSACKLSITMSFSARSLRNCSTLDFSPSITYCRLST